MRKINKIINIALVFILIGVFLCLNFAWALRVPDVFQNQYRIDRFKEAAAEVLPKAAIIILHYGRSDGIGESDTMELLKNLEDLNYSNYEIMLVDNNSPDGFFSKYKDSLLNRFPKIPKITFIKSEVNLGFSEGTRKICDNVIKG